MGEKIDANLSEEDLVQLLRNRDEKGLTYLYNNYANNLLFIISKIIHDRETCEDILQETFQKIWTSIDTYSSAKGRLYTWIVNIARNLAIDTTRSKAFKNKSKNQTFENTVILNNIDHATSIHVDSIDISDLLKTLKNDHKILVEMVYFKGHTHVEVSEKLGIPLGTVKTRLRMAIKDLRKIFLTN